MKLKSERQISAGTENQTIFRLKGIIAQIKAIREQTSYLFNNHRFMDKAQMYTEDALKKVQITQKKRIESYNSGKEN